MGMVKLVKDVIVYLGAYFEGIIEGLEDNVYQSGGIGLRKLEMWEVDYVEWVIVSYHFDL